MTSPTDVLTISRTSTSLVKVSFPLTLTFLWSEMGKEAAPLLATRWHCSLASDSSEPARSQPPKSGEKLSTHQQDPAGDFRLTD